MPDAKQQIEIARARLAEALADPEVPTSLSPALQQARSLLGTTFGLQTQVDTMTALGKVRERQFAKCREERDSLLNLGTYLIWSNEHQLWWRENSSGYTNNVGTAGRYSREDAMTICKTSRHGWPTNGVPPEIPVREADVLICVAEADAGHA